MKKLHYVRQNWKLAFHLIFRTKHLGVNNLFYSAMPSPYGVGLPKILLSILLIFPLVKNFKLMKWRMGPSMGFVPRNEYYVIFPKK